jgi:arylsulfatase A-like enzyme
MTATKPNILFLFADDQRFDTIHALGNQAIHTPNLDRLVSRGCVFEQAHIPCGTSGAVCMPSRAMLHSGRSLFHLDGEGQCIPPEHTTLGEALRHNGYHTFGTGKWHNGCESFNRSFAAGEEIFFGGMSDHWNVPVYHYDPSGRYEHKLPETRDPARSNQVNWRRGDHINSGKHSTEMICDAAIQFLENHNKQHPFFAYVALLAPHDPRTMPQRFFDMYDPNQIELPPNFMGGHPFDTGALHIRDEMLAQFPRDPDETRRHIAEYYAMISHIDDELGRVLTTLEQQGLLDDTIIVFAGDNGLALGQHGLFGKQNCYDHSVRVPLIFAGPGVPAGKGSDALVYLLDIFPTLCELTGTAVPSSVEGQSLVPTMHDGTGRESLYFAYCDSQRAVRRHQYKLIETVVKGHHLQTQLFDLSQDPWELHNLATQADQQVLRDELRQELIQLRDRWDDLDSPHGQRFWAGIDWS